MLSALLLLADELYSELMGRIFEQGSIECWFYRKSTETWKWYF